MIPGLLVVAGAVVFLAATFWAFRPPVGDVPLRRNAAVWAVLVQVLAMVPVCVGLILIGSGK